MRILLCFVAVNYYFLTENIMILCASSDVQLTDYNIEHNSSIASSVHDVSTNVYKNEKILEETQRKIDYYYNLEFRIWQIASPILLGKLFYVFNI